MSNVNPSLQMSNVTYTEKKIEKKEIHKRTWKSIMKEKSQAANQN